MGNVLTVENKAIQSYALCSSILVMKMLLMAPLTVKERISAKKNSSNTELEKSSGDKSSEYAEMCLKVNPDVERVRRAHLNDLENIPAFLFIGGLYLMTNPAPNTASLLIKTYTGCRVLHSLVYAVRPMPPPTRGIIWGVGYGITFYMAVKVAIHVIRM
ncbi:microsomal glutathione S-transferase 1-like [Arctopsyche grandis]|uniref:microsomal glutathione S-transferase 1-like n=1 Tax=Arctopsyche grandis TaxID=121162 RepID=UPI00406D714D